MKNLLRQYIKKQIDFLFEVDQVDPIAKIKQMDADVKASEKEIESIKKAQKDALLQQQNKQKVVGSQVGTLGDDKSKNIKTQDVKRDVELYKKEQGNIKAKEVEANQNLELKKAQLDAEKSNLNQAKTAVTPSAPSAPPAL